MPTVLGFAAGGGMTARWQTALGLGIVLGLVCGLIIGQQSRAASPRTPEPDPSWTPVATLAGTPHQQPTQGVSALASAGVAATTQAAASSGVPTQPAQVTDAPSVTPSTKGPSPDVYSRLTVAGEASFYCSAAYRSRCTAGVPPDTLAAAAGPALRVGAWRGRVVTVTANGRSVRVRLVDWMANRERVADLFASVWAALGVPLSRGVMRVTVSW